MNPVFHKKLFFETLCLKTSIPKTAPAVPPMKERDSKENSEILFFVFYRFPLIQCKGYESDQIDDYKEIQHDDKSKTKINVKKTPHLNFSRIKVD